MVNSKDGELLCLLMKPAVETCCERSSFLISHFNTRSRSECKQIRPHLSSKMCHNKLWVMPFVTRTVFLFLMMILCVFAKSLNQTNLKVIRHTFEDGLDDWKVENQSWLRLPFSRLKQDHPNLTVPTQLNSTVKIEWAI